MKKYLILVPLSFSMIIIIYLTISYKSFFDSFKTAFNENKFSAANSLLITSNNFNPFKSYCLSSDLKEFFQDVLSDTNTKLKDNTITENEVKNILMEISHYDFLDIDTKSLLESINYKDPYTLGLNEFNNKNYVDAYNYFTSVSSSSHDYSNAIDYMNKCKESIKATVFSEADSMCNNDYYTKALELINNYDYILGDDPSTNEKIAYISNEKYKYLSKQNTNNTYASSDANITKITPNNINSLSIKSNTDYLLHVNLQDQKLYVYKSMLDGWFVSKTFTCSTGISGEETPPGVYSIQDKGQWFFSEKYMQGGKYWVQFYGNYLFHSVPFDKTQKNVLDSTLGKPASHGCIRLSVDDSKWIYDNIPIDSKVIIK